MLLCLAVSLSLESSIAGTDFKKYVEDNRCPAILNQKSIAAAQKYPALINDELFHNLAEFSWLNDSDLERQLLALLSSEQELASAPLRSIHIAGPSIESLPLGYFAVSKERAPPQSEIRRKGVDLVANEVVAGFLDRELGFNMTPLTVFFNPKSGMTEPVKSRMLYIPNTVYIDEFMKTGNFTKENRLILIHQLYKLITFDFVLGQQDRQSENYLIAMVNNRPKVIAIDHESILPNHNVKIDSKTSSLEENEYGTLGKLKINFDDWRSFGGTDEGKNVLTKMQNFMLTKDDPSPTLLLISESRRKLLFDRIEQIISLFTPKTKKDKSK